MKRWIWAHRWSTDLHLPSGRQDWPGRRNALLGALTMIIRTACLNGVVI